MYCVHGFTWTVYYTGILNLRCDWYVYMVVKTNRELAVKLMDLQRKWQKGCESIEELQEIDGKEQFYNSLKLRIMERRPKTCVGQVNLPTNMNRQDCKSQDRGKRRSDIQSSNPIQVSMTTKVVIVVVIVVVIKGDYCGGQSIPIFGYALATTLVGLKEPIVN